MRANLLRCAAIFGALWLSACGSLSPTPAPLAAATLTAPLSALPSATSPAPTRTPELALTLTPTTTMDLALARTPDAPVPDLAEMLRLFPLYQGSRWLYIRVDFSQTADPNQVVSAVSAVEERVVEVQNQPPFYFARIQRTTNLIRKDQSWDPNFALNLGKMDFWYVLTNGRVYSSPSRPDPAHLELAQLGEELDFPLTAGSSWCPNKAVRKNLTPEAETPVPCQSAGARKVVGPESVQVQAGNYDACYQMSDFYNSGGPQQWFCNGVGFVRNEYRHLGTIFGSTQWLVEFSPGPTP